MSGVADNVELNVGTGGATLATDDIGGVHYQIVKLSFGALDTATPVSASNPLPIVQTGTLNVGTVTAVTAISNALPAGTNNIGDVDVLSLPAIPAGTNNIGDVDVLTLPALPAGTNNIGDVDVLSIAAGDNNIGNVDIVTVPTDPFGANADAASATGSISAKLRFIAATGIPVTSLPNVTLAAGTNTNEIVGDVAQDIPVAGNPVLTGGRASSATPTAMSTNGDSVYNWLTLNGAQVVAGELVDDAAFTPGTSRVNPIGLQADETSTDSVDEGDIGCPRITLDRKQIVTVQAHAASGGATPYKNLDCDETEDDIKTSAGKLYWIHVINLANAKRYLKLYNATAANVTVGTTTPVLTFPIPTMGDTNGAGFTLSFGDVGVQFDTAICVAATTGFADNDTGAPGANEIILNAAYI